MGGEADSSGRFNLFAFVGESVGNQCLGAVFIGEGLVGGEGGGVVEVFVVGPVGAAEGKGVS